MSLDEIKRNIEEQAKREAGGLRQAAEKEKDSLLSEAAARIKEMNLKASMELEEELKAMGDDSDSNIELAVKDMTLSAKEEALAAEIPKVRQLLAKFVRKSKSYGKLFKAALKQAAGILPEGELVIAVNRSDKSQVAGLKEKVEFESIGGGLIIRPKSGDIRIDATLDRVMDSRMEEMKNMIMDGLFGSRKAGAAAAPKAKPQKRGAKARGKRVVKAKKRK